MTSIKRLALALFSALCFSAYSNAQVPAVTTQTHVIPDDGFASVPLQFNFPLYGQSFNQSWMFSNGIISFQDPNTSGLAGMNLSVQPMSSMMGSQFNYSIFPLWTDLINIAGTFQTEGSTTFQRYNWIGISPFYDQNRLNTFSVEIRPDGKIITNYNQLSVDYGYVGVTGNTSRGEFENIATINPGTTSLPNWERTPQAVDVCSFDPLSSATCPGYAQAYLTQQCSISPLYDPTCPGYAQAYFSYQCSISPLYDQSCPGYAQAYFTQQCITSPLYDQACPGYAEAYFTQQCNLNQLYNTQCPGYAQAKALKDLKEQQTEQTESTSVVLQPSSSQTTSTASSPLVDPTRSEAEVVTDVGGVELTLTGTISIPTGETSATKEAIKESSNPVVAVAEEKKIDTEEKKVEEKKKVDPKALAVAMAAVAATERTALQTSETAVAFSQSETATSAALGLGTGLTLQSFSSVSTPQLTSTISQPVQMDSTSREVSNLQQQRQQSISNSIEMANSNTSPVITQDVQQGNKQSVRGGGKVEGMEGGPDPEQLAKAPADFNQYLTMQIRDSKFYVQKEIYKGQRVVDNERSLRLLNARNDRVHQEMVNQQYGR